MLCQLHLAEDGRQSCHSICTCSSQWRLLVCQPPYLVYHRLPVLMACSCHCPSLEIRLRRPSSRATLCTRERQLVKWLPVWSRMDRSRQAMCLLLRLRRRLFVDVRLPTRALLRRCLLPVRQACLPTVQWMRTTWRVCLTRRSMPRSPCGVCLSHSRMTWGAWAAAQQCLPCWNPSTCSIASTSPTSWPVHLLIIAAPSVLSVPLNQPAAWCHHLQQSCVLRLWSQPVSRLLQQVFHLLQLLRLSQASRQSHLSTLFQWKSSSQCHQLAHRSLAQQRRQPSRNRSSPSRQRQDPWQSLRWNRLQQILWMLCRTTCGCRVTPIRDCRVTCHSSYLDFNASSDFLSGECP